MPFDDRDFPGLPKGERAASPRARRAVANWLYLIAGMILVMTALGGATRLTGSGLSIMEWAPVMGIVPPWSEAEWRRLFALYQKIPQYSLINDGFGLEGFKQIFWLEWIHRFWGRLLGIVFLGPLLWFGLTGRLEQWLAPRLIVFFVLGGLQGAMGWFMVASGFFPDAASVAPVRLVAHLVLALLLYSAVLWTALTLRPAGPMVADAGPISRYLVWVMAAMVGLTIVAGGFVSGLRAGLTFNTFPWMDGQLVPPGYAALEPFGRNLIANIASVQFNHRLLATLTLLAVAAATRAVWPYRAQLGWRIWAAGTAVLLQYALGIMTLLLVVPADLAVMHQIGAVLLLTAALVLAHALHTGRGAAYRTTRKNQPAHGLASRGQASRGQTGRGQASHGHQRRASPFYGFVTRGAAPTRVEDPKP